MISEEIFNRLKTLFQFYEMEKNPLVQELASRQPVMANIEKAEVLFIGINPSYLESDSKSGYTYAIQQAVVEYAKHYGKFKELATWEGIEQSWTYMDLLAVRETSQNHVMGLINSPAGLRFVVEQLIISREIIEYIQPKLIVVCNSAARIFMGIEAKHDTQGKASDVWLGYHFETDQQFGSEVITGLDKEPIGMPFNTSLYGTPCLFTGTLTYADKFNKKRLAWQINRIMEYTSVCFGEAYTNGMQTDKLFAQIATLTEQLESLHEKKKSLAGNAQFEQAAKAGDRYKATLSKLKATLILLKDQPDQ